MFIVAIYLYKKDLFRKKYYLAVLFIENKILLVIFSPLFF
ncbi:hypothetical protein bcere0017_29090 [Bacillus cereus Rock1-3]|nr:hypothetical protein MC28_2294 [Bacillus thuringiensis MC28]EEL22252.1 hypothetical protein bcere0017_29090 [Bacillus cereus Rock1-3]